MGQVFQGFDLFRMQSPNKTNFADPITLSNNSGDSRSPRIGAAGNNVYVTWRGGPTAGNNDIFFTVSNDRSAGFSSVKNLSSNPSNQLGSLEIAGSGPNVYVSWQDRPPLAGNAEIFLRARPEIPFRVAQATGLFRPATRRAEWGARQEPIEAGLLQGAAALFRSAGRRPARAGRPCYPFSGHALNRPTAQRGGGSLQRAG